MAVKKLSVALDEDVAVAAAAAAEARGQSLSSWLNEAARNRLRIDQGLAAVRDWEHEHGALTDEERAGAETVLQDLLAPASQRRT
jgi:hypothetical protein